MCPTHSLTIQDRGEFAVAWRKLIKRIDRLDNRRSNPLIYVATFAKSSGSRAGYHAHAVTWNGYVQANVLLKHVRESGLGKAFNQPLPTAGTAAHQRVLAGTYLFRQHVPILGSDDHERHDALPRYARRTVMPQKSTLAVYKPDLLSALNRAKSRSVTDDALVASLPLFSR
jgi:hypothetical protein